jgi:ribosome-binding protein aMBF1 (putative translation factor)
LTAIRDFLGYDPCPERSSVAQRLHEYRLARGWTRADLAAKLGVRAVTVSRWECCRTRLRRDCPEQVLDLLGGGQGRSL